MEQIEREYRQKKFFKTIFRGIDFKKEKIRVYQNTDTFNKVMFFNDIDELVKYTSKSIFNVNTYFQIASINISAESGQATDLNSRYCLAFDFDKKDNLNLNAKEILLRFKQLKLHYHALVDSGNGYHAYVCINKTDNLEMVQEVQNVLCNKLNADKNAIKSTQVLRVPYTFNIKNESNKKQVNIIKIDDRNSKQFKAYDIDFLYKMNCDTVKDKAILDDTNIKYTLSNTNIPPCIIKKLKNGSAEGERYEDLQKIVVTLRNRNKTLTDIKQIIKEWNKKSNYNDNLDNRIENIYKNRKYISYNCKDCDHSKECFNKIESDFKYSNDEIIINIEDKIAKQLKASNRKGVKNMNGNKLLIFNVLKNNIEGLYTDEIVKLITPRRGKPALSKPTLIKTLNSLVDDNTIIKKKGNARAGIKDFYKINSIKCDIANTFDISYLATVLCINKVISTDELRCYTHMRYKQHLEVKDNKAQGNLFRINQTELAKDLGVTQQRISEMIKGLLDSHLIDIYYRGVSKNNGFEYNVYRLNK